MKSDTCKGNMINPNGSELETRIEKGSIVLDDYLRLGKIYLERGEFNKLLNLYEKALFLPLTNIERALIMYEKGQAIDLLGKKEEAILCYEQSLKLLSNEKESDLILDIKGMNYYNLSLLLYNEKKGYEYARKALEELNHLLGKYPAHKERYAIYSYLSELYCRFNEFDKALEIYKKGFEISKNNEEKVWCLCGIASVYRDKGDYRKSEENYKQALNIAKDKKFLSKINFEMGRMYFDSKHTEEAIEAFNNALNYRAYDPVLRNNKEYIADIFWHLGTLTYHNKNYDKVIEYLSKTVENIGENHVYYCNTHITLGHCYLAKEEYSNARDHYNKALFSSLATKEEINMANECLKRIEKEYKG